MSVSARPVAKPAARAGRKCLLAKPIRNTVVTTSIIATILSVGFLIVYLTFAKGGPIFMIIFAVIIIVTWSIIAISVSTVGSAIWCRVGPFGKLMMVIATPIIILIYLLVQIWPFIPDILKALELS